jgi:hypothetical protein
MANIFENLCIHSGHFRFLERVGSSFGLDVAEGIATMRDQLALAQRCCSAYFNRLAVAATVAPLHAILTQRAVEEIFMLKI